MRNSREATAYLLREQGKAILDTASRLQSATDVLPLNVARGSQGGEDANLRNIANTLGGLRARLQAVEQLLIDLGGAELPASTGSGVRPG